VALLSANPGVVGVVLTVAALPLVVTVAVLALAARFLDRRPLAGYGLGFGREWWLDLGVGLALGAGLMTAVFLVGYALGWYRVAGVLVADGAVAPALGATLALFLSVGIYEELFARGYLLTNLAEGFGFLGEREAVAVAVAVSSAVFGVLHATNPGASAFSTASIALAGVMLAAGYVLTGELGLPIGLHIAWNLFQGAVFGLGVSGLDVGVAVVDAEPVGPALATGGSFGPEAGLLGLAAVAVGTALVVAYARWREGAVRLHPRIGTPPSRNADGD